MAKPKNNLPIKFLKERISVDPETGIAIWKEAPLKFFKNSQTMGSWNSRFAGKVINHINNRGYITLTINYNGKSYQRCLHRIIFAIIYDRYPKESIDHINGIKTDNRIINLRECSHHDNMKNITTSKNQELGLRGVDVRVTKKGTLRYNAYMYNDGLKIHLGAFATLEEARTVHINAHRAAFGEYSVYNSEELLTKRANSL